MNACVLKPKTPFATRSELKRTPPAEASKKRMAFIDSHNFSFVINKRTKELECTVTKK